MEASVSFHHKSFAQINIHSKQQQVEVPLINVFFMLVPVLNAPEDNQWRFYMRNVYEYHNKEYRGFQEVRKVNT